MFKQITRLLIPLTFIASVSTSLADQILPTNSNIRYTGRFDMTNPASPRMHWSGSQIKAWFEGSSLQVTLDCASGNDFFYAIINDGTPQKLNLIPGSQTITLATGLASSSTHKVELFKLTSYYNDNTAFNGFITDTGKTLKTPPPAPALTIQFYGDSITDGHGVDAPTETTDAQYWNNYNAYGALTARALKMEYICTAGTGLAVKHPWPNSITTLPQYTMGLHYNTINPNIPAIGNNVWSYANDKADIVVVNLFQNDSWVKPTPHNASTANGIIDAYENLILTFRAAHPNAEIICILGNMDISNNPTWMSYVNTVVNRMKTTHGDQKIKSLLIPYGAFSGHPRASEQQAMANQLTAFIQQNYAHIFAQKSETGLKAEFFDYSNNIFSLPDLSGRTPDIIRTDAQINYPSVSSAWSGLPSSMSDTFASRHTGQIEITTAGNYTFYLSSDDGSKLWLDGTEIINNDGLHGMRERSATTFLSAGLHDIRVEFFENGGGAGLTLKWSGPNIAKQTIPATAFSHKTTEDKDEDTTDPATNPIINLAREQGAVASQTSIGWGGSASRAIDGNTSGVYGEGSVTHNAARNADYWQVDLGSDKLISEIILYNRTDAHLGQRLSNYRISIINSAGSVAKSDDFYVTSGHAGIKESWKPGETIGRIVRVQQLGRNRLNDFALSLAEVEVMGSSLQTTPVTNTVPSGAKAYYSFNDSSNIGKDDSGNGFNLNPFLVNHTNAGLSQGGAAFSANTSKLTHNSIPLGTNWTVSAWYEGLDSDGWRTLFRGASYHQIIVNFSQENLGLFRNGHRDSGVNLNREDGVWHMITAVGSPGKVVYYLDGKPVGEVNGYTVDSDVRCIGNYQFGDQRFADTLDEVYLYDRQLTATEVTALYNGSNPNSTVATLSVSAKSATSKFTTNDLSTLKLEPVSSDFVKGEYNAEHQSFGTALNATIKYEWTTDFVNWYKADGIDSDENGITATISTKVNGDRVSVNAKASKTNISIFLRLANN